MLTVLNISGHAELQGLQELVNTSQCNSYAFLLKVILWGCDQSLNLPVLPTCLSMVLVVILHSFYKLNLVRHLERA